MPVIRVSCLPQTSEEELQRLHQSIVAAVVGVSELGFNTQDDDMSDMTVLFTPDMMQCGLGKEVIVEVLGLLQKPERTDRVRQKLAKALGLALRDFSSSAKVEVFIQFFDPSTGFWTSAEERGDNFRFAPDTPVRTTQEDTSRVHEFMPEALPQRRWGVWGTVIEYHDSHGLYYVVRHDDDDTAACYHPSELE